jgi:hypothetical protein
MKTLGMVDEEAPMLEAVAAVSWPGDELQLHCVCRLLLLLREAVVRLAVVAVVLEVVIAGTNAFVSLHEVKTVDKVEGRQESSSWLPPFPQTRSNLFPTLPIHFRQPFHHPESTITTPRHASSVHQPI